MKQTITKIILEWIGEDVEILSPSLKQYNKQQVHIDTGYNQALQDLRNKAPELTEKIVEMVVREIEKEGFADTREAGQFQMHSDGYNQAIEDLIDLIKK